MEMTVRVRFAPSPTGALHIGGIRTALYNYLYARQHKGVFVLRIEDTDQVRYVPGAEEYILEALAWVGLIPDEGVGFGGSYGPYRQSERKAIYYKYAHDLIERGKAYYAFDTPEELDAAREREPNFAYNYWTRERMRNSLTMKPSEVENLLRNGAPYVIRLRVEPGQDILVHDLIRGEVVFQSSELDDKVLLKADGMPTYHLANIVDDYLMRITHVIRGEEWLPSTAHHVLLYRAFGWEAHMPRFAHLPLILRPEGQGKLSKRDGVRFGFPVFPLSWKGATPEENFLGFREAGFLPQAVLNFLALLGWHPGGEQEVFTLEEMVNLFSLEHVSKSGARFDYDKAKWFNQRYILATDNTTLAQLIRPLAEKKGYRTDLPYLERVVALMKERVTLLTDFVEEGYYLFEPVRTYDDEAIQKRWNPALKPALEAIAERILTLQPFDAVTLEASIKALLQEQQLKVGEVLPILRLALVGTMKGPSVFDTIALLGPTETTERLRRGVAYFLQCQRSHVP
ncbi:MAG: glutamate--tRNA ligase [Saprospiraceae bacterium]|nr:glutamate--tRNA ligase [Saprospiraceae bacterium]MDW8483962.1 glutamate--tRNA ligase [Saprospiraceae bacterium]